MGARPVKLLKCRCLGEGIFPTEVIVSGKTADGRTFELFACKKIVRPLVGDEVGLEVTVLDSNEDEAVVVLPDYPYPININRIIRVKRSDLLD